jgi:hypothetical protein
MHGRLRISAEIEMIATEAQRTQSLKWPLVGCGIHSDGGIATQQLVASSRNKNLCDLCASVARIQIREIIDV